jgi:hypothetical protein
MPSAMKTLHADEPLPATCQYYNQANLQQTLYVHSTRRSSTKTIAHLFAFKTSSPQPSPGVDKKKGTLLKKFQGNFPNT